MRSDASKNARISGQLRHVATSLARPARTAGSGLARLRSRRLVSPGVASVRVSLSGI
jgi:hypothetical protein